jgi:hypothetical protein
MGEQVVTAPLKAGAVAGQLNFSPMAHFSRRRMVAVVPVAEMTVSLAVVAVAALGEGSAGGVKMKTGPTLRAPDSAEMVPTRLESETAIYAGRTAALNSGARNFFPTEVKQTIPTGGSAALRPGQQNQGKLLSPLTAHFPRK